MTLMSCRKPSFFIYYQKSDFIWKLKSSPTRAKNISQSRNQGIKSIIRYSYHYYKKSLLIQVFTFCCCFPVQSLKWTSTRKYFCYAYDSTFLQRKKKIFSIGKHIIGNCWEKSTEVFSYLGQKIKKWSHSILFFLMRPKS